MIRVPQSCSARREGLRCLGSGPLVMADAGAAAAEQTKQQELQGKLKERLQAEFVSAVDLSDGCGSKFQCVIISTLFEGKPLDLEALMRKVEVVPDQVDAMDVLDVLRRSTRGNTPCRARERTSVGLVAENR